MVGNNKDKLNYKKTKGIKRKKIELSDDDYEESLSEKSEFSEQEEYSEYPEKPIINVSLFDPSSNFLKDYFEKHTTEGDSNEENYDLTNEKIKANKDKIDKINQSGENNYTIFEKVLLSNLDDKIKANIISKLENKNIELSDKNKLYTWVNQVLKLPIGIYKPIIDSNPSQQFNFDFNNFLYDTKNKLDKAVYGMENAKEEILDFLVKYIKNPYSSSNNVIGLKGDKGVGKTRICRALSDILNIPFFQISMGGLTDSSVLLGYDNTYIGSKCGKIASILQQAKCMNFILYIDELDKSNTFSRSNEVQGVLTHLFDESQNSNFQDLYFEGIPLDLSKVLIISSFNDEHKLDPIVLNRMKVINIKNLTEKDKITIVKKHVLNEINTNNFYIEDCVIEYIIKYKTEQENGMRNVKKNIETIINRLNTILILQECKDGKDITRDFSYKEALDKFDKKNITREIVDILLQNNTKKIPDNILYSMYV